MCGSDVQIINVPPGHPSTPPVIIGHEFVGRIRSAGSGARDVVIGSRVVVDPDPKCGRCDPCRAGRPANCVNIVALGVHRDGALARYVTTPANSVYPISEEVPAALAALVEPLACVVNGTNRAAIRPGEPAVVFGAGAIGCLFIAVLPRRRGADRRGRAEREARPGGPRRRGRRGPHSRAWAAGRAEAPGGAEVVVDAVGSVLPHASGPPRWAPGWSCSG